MDIPSNFREKGYFRDREILETISIYKCLNTEQIEHLIFNNIQSSKRVCQNRLKKLTEKGKLKRWRYSLEEPYAYYIELNNKVEQMEHLINLNWAILWIRKNLNNWQIIESHEYEIDYKILRCDAFVSVKNTFTNKYEFYFVELDRGWSSNKFDKIKKYNDLYESNILEHGIWWRELTERFPKILIATTTDKRLSKINDIINTDNKNDLNFICCQIGVMRKEVLTK